MVSRDFEIYYYKDQHMKKVANHIHDYYEIYFFLEGDVSLEIEKKEYPLQYGDVAVVPPGLEHHAVIHDESVPYRRFVFWITVDYLNRLMEDAREYGYLIQLVQTKLFQSFWKSGEGFPVRQRSASSFKPDCI